MSDPRFPIGKAEVPSTITAQDRERFIYEIEQAPVLLALAVQGLTDAQLDTPCRDGGWTVRQVVHHLPDSHLNSYVRYKLALTENEPTIKPYDEAAWANTHEARTGPVEMSLELFDSLHRRWVALLNSMSESDWKRTFKHPERGVLALDQNVALYAWHGKHHVAHITELRKRMGW
jgi:hypothetical protein